jgi:hypothetical protein
MKKQTNPALPARIVGACFLLAMMLDVGLIAQEKKNDNSQNYRQYWQIPELLQSKYLAMGDRLQKPGKERVIMDGVLTDSSGSNVAQVIMEKGGKLRLDISTPNRSKSLRFDGKNAYNKTSEDDDHLLEAMVDDSPEMFFEATAEGSFSLVGLRFADKNDNLYDVYDAPIPAKGNPTHPRPPKRYFFDSKTKLLCFIQYRENKERNALVIETQFSDWVVVDGQKFPSKITRKKQGNIILILQGNTFGMAPAAADNLFVQ